MILWHEPTDPLLTEFHRLELLTPSEWAEHYRVRSRHVRAERWRNVAAILVAAGAVLATTHTMAWATGRAGADALDYSVVSQTVENASRALAVCYAEDALVREHLARLPVGVEVDEP